MIANPLDIERYQVEFYNLAQVDQGRAARLAAATSALSQLRAAGRARQAATSSSTPTTATSSTSSTGCGNTPSSSARATSTSSRGATPGIVRFRIDGVLHQVYQIPTPVLVAMTARIKILGAHGRRREAPPAGRPHQDAHAATARRSSCASRRMPTAFGEKLVMRIFDPEVLVRDFTELGFPHEDQRALGAT